MRLREVPRGLPDDDQFAEPLEVGSGMSDPRARHGMSLAERRHFEELEDRSVDPRDAPSNFHDPRPRREEGVLIDDMRGPAARSVDEVLCRGQVVGCFMQSDGAHLEVAEEDGVVHYLFWPGCKHVVGGTWYTVTRRPSDEGERLSFREVRR